jgi:hypothetical protein
VTSLFNFRRAFMERIGISNFWIGAMTDHRFSEERAMYRRALRIMSVLDARLLMI